MRGTTISLGLWVAGLLALPAAARAQIVTVLHSFQGGTTDGAGPGTALLQSGSSLYGMTDAGGSTAGDGVIFQIGTNGTGYNIVHSFLGLPNDGANPAGGLIQSGTTFYGLTSGGGSADEGTVFVIGANGAPYGLLHQFAGGAADGIGPMGSLVQSGSVLFGVTTYGGAAGTVGGLGLGTVFKIGTDGTGFSLLHTFTGAATDGQSPNYGALALSGSTLYGMTVEGGTAAIGVIFKINTDGTGFSVLHSFTGAANDGKTPFGSVIVSGSTLYGMTRNGGVDNTGAVFKINTDGTGFGLLHSFAGTSGNDGANPDGDLTLVGSMLYGMTTSGGPDALGTIFGMNTDGSDYSVLHNFIGGPTDGAEPQGDLTYFNSTLYGMTGGGGSGNDGTIFSFPIAVPEPSSLLLVGAGAWLAVLIRRRAFFHFFPRGA